MYNNDVTYDTKWETEENKKALKLLQDKYFDRSECSPSCPVSWAKEVLDLLSHLDSELGIRYNESTLRGFRISGNFISWFITGPWVGIYNAFVYAVRKPKIYEEKNRVKRMLRVPKLAYYNFTHSFAYGFKALMPRYLNRYRNQLLKKKVTLSQIKEKYGSLTLYTSSSEAFNEYIDEETRICEIKLSIKGAYHPVESMYNLTTSYHVGNRYRPDIVITEPLEDGGYNLKRTIYREVMQELGLDLSEIAEKAERLKNKREAARNNNST